jgi:DNA-binding NarL/FixJ family response regulator
MKRLRVLVADDHDGIRCSIVELLSKDYEVIGAVSDGEELVRSAICLLPDVIVSDIVMPRMGAQEARKELAARQQEIPFVFVSTLGKEAVLHLSNDSTVALVHKADLLGHLCKAVSAVYGGQPYLSPDYR